MTETAAPMRCDVLVVGGGSAGVAAAVASARAGARTMLIERQGALGGMASVALVHSICGLYLLGEETAGEAGAGAGGAGKRGAVLANAGFPSEFANRLLASDGAWGPRRMGKVDVLLQHPAAFATLCDELVQECPSLTVRLHTEVIAVHGQKGGEGRVRAVETRCRMHSQIIEPAVVVDASGDAEVVAQLDAADGPDVNRPLQRPAFIFSLLGVAPSALDRNGRVRLAARIAQAVRSGDLPQGATGASMHAIPAGRGGEAFVTIDLEPPTGVVYDPTDPACLTALEMHGRSLAASLTRFLRARIPDCEGARIASLPGRVGVRESRQIRAATTLRAEHLRVGAEFEDGIALATWPMELRETAKGPRLRYPDHNKPCEIPLGSLRVAEVGNVYAAGRCIGCDHEAQASIRVMGTCFATGQAAGLAAALLAAADGRATHKTVTAAAVIAERRRVMRWETE